MTDTRASQRSIISQGQKAYFKSGKQIVEPAQQGTAATVSSQHMPSAAHSAAPASASHQYSPGASMALSY